MGMKYAFKNENGWQKELVPASNHMYADIDLSLAKDDTPYIVFMHMYGDGVGPDLLYYTVKDQGIWSTNLVTSVFDSTWLFDSAVDQSGQLHVVYFNDASGMVKYKVLERDGTWYEREIGDGGTSFDYNALNRHISIATDSADQPHIIYSASTNSVTYAYKEGSGWNTEIIDDLSISSYSQGDCSIAIDTNGYPHVIYADVANGALKYAVKNSHGWQKEIVDSGPDFLSIGVINSLALDSANSPHILYNNNGMLHSFLIPQLPDIPRIEPSTTHIVAADGGTALAGSGGLYTKHGIVIPAGSLAQDTEIEIKQPDDDHGLYSAVEIGPTNTVFSKPATITIEYKDSDVPFGT